MLNTDLKNALELENISMASAYFCNTDTCNTFLSNSISSLNIDNQNIRSIYKNFDSLVAQLSTFTINIDRMLAEWP